MDKSDFDLDYTAEAARWFDHWLKGIDNGISEEAPIHYYVMGAPQESTWQASQGWPPPGLTPIPYYFAQGRSGTVASVNDGSLNLAAPLTWGLRCQEQNRHASSLFGRYRDVMSGTHGTSW